MHSRVSGTVEQQASSLIEVANERGKAVDNLIDWKLELTLQERLSAREARVCFVDEAPLTLAIALVPWLIIMQLMF